MRTTKFKCLSVLAVLVLFVMLLSGISPALAATAPSLGAAQSFLVLGGSTATNTGSTVVNGDLGVWPGTAITGFPPGIVIPPGTIHATDAVAQQAQSDVTVAYVLLAGQAPDVTYSSGQDLGGLTLTPGVYRVTGAAGLTGTLTLDALGNPNSVFVFQIDSALTTASGSSVVMINSGSYCNVFWQIGSSATIGTASTFGGNILALTSITMNTGATLVGRALARNGAVTMDTNTISVPVCPLAAAPSISVVKTTILDRTVVSPNNQADIGDRINYTFVVTNTGNVPLTNVTVSDVPALTTGPTPPSVASLDAGAIATFTGTYTLTQADIDAGNVSDTATVTGTPPVGNNVKGQDTKDVNLGQGPASISVVKNGVLDMTVVSPNNQANVGDRINYSFVVTNTGSVTLTNVTINDIPALTAGPIPASITSLAAGAIATFTGSYTLTQTNINAGNVTDSATATGTPPTGNNVTGQDTKTVNLQAPSISLVKNGVLDMTVVSPNNQANVGDKISYTFTVTNTGMVTLTNVMVIDPNITVTGGPIASLGPGASDTTTFTGIHVLTQADITANNVVNTAVVVGTSPTGSVTDLKIKTVSLKSPVVVGVEVYNVDKVDLLKASMTSNQFSTTCIGLTVIIVTSGGILALTRRRTH